MRAALEVEAARLDTDDYSPGDCLYALLYTPDGETVRVVHEITAEDLAAS